MQQLEGKTCLVIGGRRDELEVSGKKVRVNALAPGATATDLYYRQNGGTLVVDGAVTVGP